MSEPERSIAAIYERYQQSLYRFCFSIVGNAEDAQDALQNAMVKALQALPDAKREIQLKPWLYRIAHNESIEILRKRREEVQIDPETVASSQGPAETAAMRERLRQLLEDLSGLPERQRGAVVMRELAGLGFEEIGEAFGTSAAVARQTVYEARLGLQELEAGREMSCETVMRQISDGDGRVLRRRDVRAHLRACSQCRGFRDSIESRHRDLAALAPLPAAASAGILHALLGGGASGQAGASAGGAGAAGVAGQTGAGAAGAVGAGKVIATSAVLKSVATVAVVAVVGATAADRSGLINTGLTGGNTTEKAATRATGAATRSAVNGLTGTSGEGGGRGSSGEGGSAHRNSGGARSGSRTAQATPQPAASSPHAKGHTLPLASRHGQETAAAHKAEPARHGGKGHAHGAPPHKGGRGGRAPNAHSNGSAGSHPASKQPSGSSGDGKGATGAANSEAPGEGRKSKFPDPPEETTGQESPNVPPSGKGASKKPRSSP